MGRIVLLWGLAFFVVSAANNGEEVWGWDCGPQRVSFWVDNFGCTEKFHFEVLVDSSRPPTIVLNRKVADPCLETPREKYIEFTYSEIGIRPPQDGQFCGQLFRVGNPVRFP